MRGLVLKAKMWMPQETIRHYREHFLKQRDEGLIVFDDTFEIAWAPSEWINVKTIKPDSYKDILFCDKAGIIYAGTKDGLNRFIDRSGEAIKDVVAWMPAPEPYEEET